MAGRRKHEPDLSTVGPIAWTMLLTLVLVLVSGLLLWVAYPYWRPQPPPPLFEPLPVPPGQPRLQWNPRADMVEYQRQVEQRLHGVGWVDRRAGVVHIPIERAMTLLLERGLPEEANEEKTGTGNRRGEGMQ